MISEVIVFLMIVVIGLLFFFIGNLDRFVKRHA